MIMIDYPTKEQLIWGGAVYFRFDWPSVPDDRLIIWKQNMCALYCQLTVLLSSVHPTNIWQNWPFRDGRYLAEDDLLCEFGDK